MIPAETISEIGGERIKLSSGGIEFKHDIFDMLQECLQMPQCNPTSTKIKGKRKKMK
jgi:hypothetical protein